MEINRNQPSWDDWVSKAKETALERPLKVSWDGAVVQAPPKSKAHNQTLRDLKDALTTKFGRQKGTELFDQFFRSHAELDLPVRAQEILAVQRAKYGFDETNKSPQEYFKTTNEYWVPYKSVRETKKEIQTALKDPRSKFSKTFSGLDQDTRRKLGIALLSGNGVQIEDALKKSGLVEHLKSKPGFDSLKRLAEHDNYNDTRFLNTTVRRLVRELAQFDAGRRLEQAETITFVRDLFHAIPDSQLSPAMKTSMLKEIFPSWIGESNVAKGISDKTYESALPLLTTDDVLTVPTKSGERVPTVGKIDEISYRHAIRSPKLDRAEYIVLTLGLLQGEHALSQDKTNQVLENFYNYKYDDAINILKAELQGFGETDKLPPAFQDALKMADTIKARPVNARANQDARRYFETTLGQLYLGGFVDAPAVSAVTEHGDKMKATNGAEVEKAILTWTDSEKLNKRAHAEEAYYRVQSPNAPIKDRKFKLNFSSKRDLADSSKKTEVVASHQGGLLRQTSPFLPDQITTRPSLNRASDIYTHGYDEKLYPMKRPEAPFTASISGHMYFVMGRLHEYMDANRKDPNLQKNVSEFVKAVISVYAKNGYHNNFEIRDVFAEPAVQKMFQKYGVKPDLSYSPANLYAAMQATIRYTAAYAEKRAMQEELRSGFKDLEDPQFRLSYVQTRVTSEFPVVDDSRPDDSTLVSSDYQDPVKLGRVVDVKSKFPLVDPLIEE
jgi:uncharacterized membrane protein